MAISSAPGYSPLVSGTLWLTANVDASTTPCTKTYAAAAGQTALQPCMAMGMKRSRL